MNQYTPDTFVLVVAALSEKLVEKERMCVELADHIKEDHAHMDDMQRTITDLRAQSESKYDEMDELRVRNENLSNDKYRLENRVYDMEAKLRNQDYIEAENARMKEELLTLKYGVGGPDTRVRNFMLKEGGKLWSEGKKIECIKGVKMCTGWGLKEAKDYSEEWGPRYAPEPTSQEGSGPHTKRSQDLPQGVGDGVKKSA